MTLFIPDLEEGEIIAPGHQATARLNALWDYPELERIRHETDGVFIPPVRLVSIPDVEMRANFQAYRDGAPIFAHGLYPDHVKTWHDKGVLGCLDVEHVVDHDEPAFCVTTFPLRTYGHFLLEMLPKILLALALQEGGRNARIAFPSDAGAATEIVKRICPPESLLLYESRKERLRLRTSLHPTLLMQSQMHNLGVALVRLLTLRMALEAPATQTLGPRLFLSRQKWPVGYRTLANEGELSDVASDFGFQSVHPQDLSWPEQIRMFAGATHVISAYNSALHGTLFCPAGTRLFSLGRVNSFQDSVSASMGHHIGYLSPSVGELSRYDPLSPKPQIYEVSPADLRERLASEFT
jgi:capsular polysaccharide biosynthesis protein